MDTAESAETGVEYEGFFDDYDCIEEWGKIRSGDELFNFSFNGIKDPLLYAEMMSSPYTVLEDPIKFNARDHKSKKTNKVSKVAFDICGTKEYTKQEIDEFVAQRYITRDDVREWLDSTSQKETEGEATGYFRIAVYEPLRALDTAARENTVPEKIAVPSDRTAKEAEEARRGERKAVSLLLGSSGVNPFKDLPWDTSGKKYFQEAHHYMVGSKNPSGEIVGVDLDKAEKLFIQSIKAKDQTDSAVANLVNIYIKQGGDSIVKGLQLLEEFGDHFPAEKVTNLRIQLIDKSENFEALEQILLSAISNCGKKNTLWHYVTKLARLYYKQQRWAEAIEWFGKGLSCIDNNKSEFPQYQRLHYYNLKSLIIAKYAAGNREEAIAQAKDLIKTAPEDTALRAILEGTFEPNKDMEDMEELKYEDDLFAETNSEISLYLRDKLQRVDWADLNRTFGKVAIVYDKLQNGRYIGNAEDSNRAVKFINENLLGRNKRGISADSRSQLFIGIARIISDSRENSSSSNGDKVISLDEVKHYLAKYARYSADVLVDGATSAALDSIRFLYILALRYLEEKDNGNISVAMNMLIASFFVEQTKLPDELHDMGNSGYNDRYYKMNCLSVKDLLIASFMLKDRQKYVTAILKEIYNEPSLRQKVVDYLNNMTGSEKEISQYYDFDSLWKKAERTYFGTLEQLGKEISDSINEYHMLESVENHTKRIHEILEGVLLWNQDEQVIENYLRLISLIGDTIKKYTVQEQIKGFETVEKEIEKQKGDIEKAPTEFSYDYVYSKLDELRFSIRERRDELYQSSRPECKIFLLNESVYVNENKAEITITFQNENNKQDAEAVEITLEGSEGASFDHFEKKFTSVRSGESQDYLAVFSLDEKAISEGQLEVTVSMQYTYKDSVENYANATISEILPVNITDKDQYVKIDNKYDNIIRGTGVNTPELFKGRNELIDSICASMSSADGIMTKNRGIILWGQRRVGKNSVKDYLKEKIRSEYPDAYIFIELGSIGKNRNLREVLISIINDTDFILSRDYEELYDDLIEMGIDFSTEELEKSDSYMPAFSRFMNLFSSKLKKLSPDEKNIPLFFIDEFSYIYQWIEEGEIDGTEFMRFWKSFISDYGICAIIIAQDNIPVWKSKYENEFACMNHSNEITYLDYEGARELICEPCRVDDKELFTQEAVKLIYELTKGSAYLIVIFCKHIIDYLNENYTEKATKTIVQLVLEKNFLEGNKDMFNAGDFEPQIGDTANVGNEGKLINALNEELLKEIAISTKESPQVRMDKLKFFEKHGDQANKIFTRLKERKIIEVERDTYCSISMPLLKLYLLRDQLEKKELKETLNKMIR